MSRKSRQPAIRYFIKPKRSRAEGNRKLFVTAAVTAAVTAVLTGIVCKLGCSPTETVIDIGPERR